VRLRRAAKRAFWAGILGAAADAAWRWWQRRVPPRTDEIDWTTAPFPFPPEPRPAAARATTETAPAAARPWAEPDGDGACPADFPIKAKLGSGIYHVPGGASYERTRPDRCYADEDAARRDGLRRSKV
jgi:hypothetical protein